MLQTTDELENFLYLMENSNHYDSVQLQLIQQFRTMVESNEHLVSQDIDVHAKGLRQHEADTDFVKSNIVDIKCELSDLETHVFDLLCNYMSQDNIVVVTIPIMLNLLSLKRRNTYVDVTKRLEQLGYICKIPLNELLLNQKDGIAWMINPMFASKSRDATQIKKFFISHIDKKILADLDLRFNDIDVKVSQINVGSTAVKNHKLRYNKITDIKKVSASSQRN